MIALGRVSLLLFVSLLVSLVASQTSATDRETALPPVVVTGTRSGLHPGEVPANVTILRHDDLEESGALTVDDALRQLPDFNTFRRSSSLVTAPAEDPEAQGVTLRGIGPGGASRALVLVDGVPANDPFGGWLYWGEMPPDSIDRIEVVRGGVSSLWGDFAEAGVVNIITRPLEPGHGSIFVSGGSRSSTRDALAVAEQVGRVRVGVRGSLIHTDGWNIVAPAQRGPIDQDAGLDAHNVAGRLEAPLGEGALVYGQVAYHGERRDLGTPFRASDVSRLSVSGGGRLSLLGGMIEGTVFSHVSHLRQTFSQANTTRTAEVPTQRQLIPAHDIGGAVVWSRSLVGSDLLTVGADLRLIEGESDDAFFNAAGTEITGRLKSSGQQRFIGIFGQEVFTPLPHLEVTFGARLDSVASFDGKQADNHSGVTRFPSRQQVPMSARLGLRYDCGHGFTVRGAGYRAFRAPTLAELYRRSTVEALVLTSNAMLRPEYLDGGELGFDYAHSQGSVHLTAFWNNLREAISNFTTRIDPATGEDLQRGRANFGLARVRGVELEGEYQIFPTVELLGRYIYSEALTLDAPDPALDGKFLTQVPAHAGIVGLRYSDPRLFTLRVQTRAESRKFEDADNHDALGGYYTIDASLSRELPAIGLLAGERIFVAAQNLLNRSYEVDKGSGILKVGTPLLLTAGLEVQF